MTRTLPFVLPIRSWVLALGAVVFTASVSTAGPAQFVIVNLNAPGVGFNDPTPVAPVGGNTGTTLGQQRLIAFQHAAGIWSARLDSAVPIRIRAQFVSLAPGVLGSAGPTTVHANFAGAPLPNTWYAQALANKASGADRSPANDDMAANFSTNFDFYLGLDNNHGARPDLVTVLLHEFAHGLGFIQFSSLTTGALLAGLPDAYNRKLLDTALGLYWPQMTNAQRVASATNWGRVVFDGPYVTAGVPNVLDLGSPTCQVDTPASISGVYQCDTADFGPRVGHPNVSAYIAAAVDPADAAGPSTADGCSPFTNAPAVVGKIALVERGTCSPALKARNATSAGATAVMIYNQTGVADGVASFGPDGVNEAFVLIPTVSVRRADALAMLGQLGSGVFADIFADLTLRVGADALNRPRVYAPLPVRGGSSISHYDQFARRNLLMEPFSNDDTTHKVKAPDDLTFELLRDLGWTFPDADADGVADDEDCNPNSDRRPTILIGGIDTGVPNQLFATGCTSADLIAQLAAAATTHGSFVSAVAELTNTWVQDGIVTGAQKGAIESGAARYVTR